MLLQKNHTLIFFIFLLIAIVWGSSCDTIASDVEKNWEGEQALNFTEKLKDGSSFELNELKGKYVLLDFWGSWCPPCRRANKGIVKLHDEFHGKSFEDAEGFEIVSVASETDKSAWESAIIKDQLNWKYHIITYRTDPNRLSKRYQLKRIPAPILIDPNGLVVGFKWSEKEMRDYLQKKLK